MTWAEFKKKVEDAGVKEDMEIDYIDISIATIEAYGGPDVFICQTDNTFSVQS